jgi:hypothetical protein
MGMVMAGNGQGKTAGGLILSGLDTLLTNKLFGFDFVTQTACTSSSDYPGCQQHFYFQNFGNNASLNYHIGLWLGYGIKMGKMNLDSIRTAPLDSIFYLNDGTVDIIPPDSLSFRLGNVYVLKTGTDPRPIWNRPFYAKIKILKFVVIDSTNHSVKMVFLWAYDNTGTHNLATSGLDTFHLDGTSSLPSNHQSPSHANLSSVNKTFFTIATSKFTLPQSLLTPNTFVTIYDLSGRTLCRLAPANAGTIDLRRMGAAGRVFLIKVEN